MHKAKFSLFIAANVCFLAGATPLFAESGAAIKLPGNNQSAAVTVPAQSSSATELVFYSVLKGNITSQISVEVLGPKGLETSVEASQMKGSAQDTLNKGKFWKIYLSGTLVEPSKRAAVKLASAQLSPGPTVMVRSTNSDCDILPPEVISLILETLSKQKGRPVTYAEYCSGVNPPLDPTPGGTSNPANNSAGIDQRYGSSSGFVEKDSCSGLNSYLVRITVRFNKVSPEILAQGFEVKASLQESEYNGSRAASLKPISDGKYAPRPLLLMVHLGGAQWVNLVSWTGGVPRILKKVPATPDLAFHRGLLLIRILADKLLAGGNGKKINYELTNGRTVYNICGPWARTRWRVNGYPS